jgi:hypothetical protein
MQTFACAFWLLDNFNNQCEGRGLYEWPLPPTPPPMQFILCYFLKCKVSQKCNCHIRAELAVCVINKDSIESQLNNTFWNIKGTPSQSSEVIRWSRSNSVARETPNTFPTARRFDT